MLHCYGMPRRVRADGLAGAALRPVRGLMPGCAAAIRWLALVVTMCLARDIAALGAVPRDYVDNLVALCCGPGRMSAFDRVWQALVELVDVFGVRLSLRQCVQRGTSACDRAHATARGAAGRDAL